MSRHARRTTASVRARASGLLAIALVIGLLSNVWQAQHVSAASNGQWSVFPTTPRGQAPREFFHPVLMPGKSYADSVTVANYTSAQLTFHLYGADAVNARGGGLSVKRRTDTQTDMGRWIKLPYPELTVPARSASVVPFTILPPSDASPGDHVGGIVAEQTQGVSSRAGSVPITVLQAVGVRVYGRVVGPLNPRLALEGPSLSVLSSVASEFGGSVDARVSFRVSNPGNTVLAPVATIVVTSPFGTATRRTLVIGQLLPGNSLAYGLTFPGLAPDGHLTARVTVSAPAASATATASAWTVPWGLLVVIILVVALVVALLVRRHRRRLRQIKLDWEDPALASDDDGDAALHVGADHAGRAPTSGD